MIDLFFRMPCRWQKTKIIVMEEVWVAPPYTANDVDGQDSQSAGVKHVKKIVSVAWWVSHCTNHSVCILLAGAPRAAFEVK